MKYLLLILGFFLLIQVEGVSAPEQSPASPVTTTKKSEGVRYWRGCLCGNTGSINVELNSDDQVEAPYVSRTLSVLDMLRYEKWESMPEEEAVKAMCQSILIVTRDGITRSIRFSDEKSPDKLWLLESVLKQFAGEVKEVHSRHKKEFQGVKIHVPDFPIQNANIPDYYLKFSPLDAIDGQGVEDCLLSSEITYNLLPGRYLIAVSYVAPAQPSSYLCTIRVEEDRFAEFNLKYKDIQRSLDKARG